MKTIIIFSLCCINCLFLASCGRTHCPAFPEYLVDYFPYKTDDILSFVNQYDDTVSFRIREVIVSKKYTEDACGKCKCESPYYKFYAHCLKNDALLSENMIFGYKSNISLEISNYYWDSGQANSTGSSVFTIFTKYEENPYNLPNIALFGETIIHENSDQQIFRLEIVKGKGITEFYDQKYDFQWKSIKK